MIGNHSLFSELNGFVIYDPQLLKKYLEENNLKDNNVLNYFIETEHGDIITKNGIAIPMVGIEDDYYNFSVINDTKDKIIIDKKISSKGWIIQIISDEIIVCGIGYFCNIETINDNNSLKFSVKNGWYEVEITGGNAKDKLFYEFLMDKKEIKPKYYGDINFEYKI